MSETLEAQAERLGVVLPGTVTTLDAGALVPPLPALQQDVRGGGTVPPGSERTSTPRRSGRPPKTHCLRGHLLAEHRGSAGCMQCNRDRTRERYRAKHGGRSRAEALALLVERHREEYEALLRGEV